MTRAPSAPIQPPAILLRATLRTASGAECEYIELADDTETTIKRWRQVATLLVAVRKMELPCGAPIEPSLLPTLAPQVNMEEVP